MALPAVIVIGCSLGFHSLVLTLSLLLGVTAVWWLGYWILSKNCYYISSTAAGFKDAFRAREVRFEEIRSVNKSTTRYSQTLTFQCETRTVTMPFDPMDQTWFTAVKAELSKRDIPISMTAFGFPVKQ